MWLSGIRIIRKLRSRFALGITSALVALPFASQPSQADTNLAVGNCNVQLINSTAKSIIVCPTAPDASKSISVSYLWLDSRLASFLIANQLDPNLKSLMGERPFVMRNDVYQTFKDLVDRFGSVAAAHSKFAGSFYDIKITKPDGRTASRYRRPFNYLAGSGLRDVKIYDGESPIYWPDLDAAEQMLRSQNLPSGYEHYFRDGWGMETSSDVAREIIPKHSLSSQDKTALENFIALALVNWRHIQPGELQTYNLLLQQLSDRALQERLPLDFPIAGPKFDETKIPDDAPRWEWAEAGIKKLVSLAARKNIRAMQYVAQGGVPSGFLTAFGIFEGSHSAPMWTIVSFPPRLFMRIAIVENIAPTPANYPLSSFSTKSSVLRELRAMNKEEQRSPVSVAFPPGILAHREKIVVPLGLEFRRSLEFDREDGPQTVAPDSAASGLVRQALDRLAGNTVRLLEPELSGARKPKQRLYGEHVLVGSSEFFYGPQIELVSALIDGKEFPMRQPSTRGVYTVAGIDGASCPVLYTRTADGDELIKVGTILRSANRKVAQNTERVLLPKDTMDVVISEEEPEITTLQRFEVNAVLQDGTSKIIAAISGPRTLRSGEFAWLKLPSKSDVDHYELIVGGYYDAYSSLLIESASRRH